MPERAEDQIARLRLIRSDQIGPITYFQLLARFGSAGFGLVRSRRAGSSAAGAWSAGWSVAGPTGRDTPRALDIAITITECAKELLHDS